MKRIFLILGLVLLFTNGKAQESKASINVSADLVSRYVWRGVEYGNSPAIQPSFTYSNGGFSVGAWGNYSFNTNTRGTELDLFASYEFSFGLALSITDYYFPVEYTSMQGSVDDEGNFYGYMTDVRSGDYFDYKNDHAFELGVTQGFGDFSLSANYFFTNNMNNDMYFEAAYDLSAFSIFVGAGNESYTDDGNYDLINMGISASKMIKVTDSYSFPVFGSLILNPNINQFHFVVGMSI